ncbi:uncharacterized protein LOC143593342 [Bidens hawaiensis]|uniref:uncharacterized protein LOC143593342 n=1 Tax=Bidens hawaiensis TaxID=980011 RepID=UPI00404A3CD7
MLVSWQAEEVAKLKNHSGRLPNDTMKNPNRHNSSSSSGKSTHINQVSTLRSGKVYDNGVNPPTSFVEGVVEDLGENGNLNKKEIPATKETGSTSQAIPFPLALVDPASSPSLKNKGPQQEEMWEVFKQVKNNLHLINAIKPVPAYAKYLKEFFTQNRTHKMPKHVDLTVNVSSILTGILPPELQDPGTPIIPIEMVDFIMTRALLDLGAGSTGSRVEELPKHLKYVLLGERETLPTIIASYIEETQVKALIEELKEYKAVIGWTIADLKGISPSIFMHKINSNPKVKPAHDAQRRLNPNMKEVVKNEVLKWLDANIIFLISVSMWVSPAQAVPKKAGIQITQNEAGEEIATQPVTGFSSRILAKEEVATLLITRSTTSFALHFKTKVDPRKAEEEVMGPCQVKQVGNFGEVEIKDFNDHLRKVISGHPFKPYLEDADLNKSTHDSEVCFIADEATYSVD